MNNVMKTETNSSMLFSHRLVPTIFLYCAFIQCLRAGACKTAAVTVKYLDTVISKSSRWGGGGGITCGERQVAVTYFHTSQKLIKSSNHKYKLFGKPRIHRMHYDSAAIRQ